MSKGLEALESLAKLEECAYAMKDLPKSNWIDLAENEAELDLKIMDWVVTIKFELFKGKRALQRLEAIDNTNPSEALKALDRNIVVIREKDYTIIEQALLELKQIKEANPSKAMECLERIDKEYATIENEDFKICFNTIKQALIKAQEQEKENQEDVKIATLLKNKKGYIKSQKGNFMELRISNITHNGNKFMVNGYCTYSDNCRYVPLNKVYVSEVLNNE